MRGHAERLREIADRARPVALSGERLLPVADPIAELFPGGGLRRGSTITVAGSTSLALTVVAAASAAGTWCAAVGMPSLGLMAAAEAGIDLTRFPLVPQPGDQWAAVAAALVDAVDLVLVRAPARARPADCRRLSARARERGSVLVINGRWVEGADVRLSIAAARWDGLGQGHGHLTTRKVEIVAAGRGAAARERRVAV
jgi:hypothetical protein